MSLRLKIVSIFTLLIVLPTAFLGYSNYNQANDILANELNRTSMQIIHRIEDTIDLFMDSMEEVVEASSNNQSIQNIYDDTENAKDSMLASFKNIADAFDSIQHIYLGTPDKAIYIYPHAEFAPDFDPTTRPWYTQAIQEDSVIWTDPYIDAITGDLVISSAKAIYAETTGDLIGVVSFDISLGVLSDLVKNVNLGQSGFAAVTDQHGKIMMHQNSEVIGEVISSPELLTLLTSESTGTTDFQEEDEVLLGVFSTLDRTGWKVLGIIPYSEIRSNTSIILNNILIKGGIVLIIALLMAFIFSGVIIKSLKVLVEDMNKVGKGDFTVRSRILSNDEIGQLSKSLNTMIENLAKLLQSVQIASKEVHIAAVALASTAEETSASTEEVARTVEEIAKGASEQASEAEKGSFMTSNLANKFDALEMSSKEMLEASENVVASNEKGLLVVKDLQEKNAKNNTSLLEIERAVQELNRKTQSIEGILETISNIAGQTNLLALNAAIEAARAGDAGRGFAVVADEIRKLAEQSAASTDEIQTIISTIREESNNTVNIMLEVTRLNKERDVTVQEVGSSFQDISNAIAIITEKIHHINDYVIAMSKDKDEIVSAIENISAVSEETAASSQEVTASMEQTSSAIDDVAKAAEDLNRLAEKLNQEVKNFQV